MTSGSVARRAGKPIGRRAPHSPCGYQSSCAQRRRFARHFWKRISLGTSRLMAAALPHRRPSFQNKPPSPPSSSRRTRRSCHNGSSRLRAFLSRGPMNCCAPTRLWHGHRDEENVEPAPVAGRVRGEARVRPRMPRRPLPPPPCSRIRACYVCGTFTTIRLSACTSCPCCMRGSACCVFTVAGRVLQDVALSRHTAVLCLQSGSQSRGGGWHSRRVCGHVGLPRAQQHAPHEGSVVSYLSVHGNTSHAVRLCLREQRTRTR